MGDILNQSSEITFNVIHGNMGPRVMGIINVTPDSFYSGSRVEGEAALIEKSQEMISSGASIIDIGGFSTKPLTKVVSLEEERKRLIDSVKIVRREFPLITISADTFRATLAKEAIDNGADIINDISGGDFDINMLQTVVDLGVPYILTHHGDITYTSYIINASAAMKERFVNGPEQHHDRAIISTITKWFEQKISLLHDKGFNNIILDPGIGFGKSIRQNYCIVENLDQFLPFELPLIVGLSRKSLIYNVLGCKPEAALNGTTVLHTISLIKGASILRVHDVKEAIEAIKLTELLRNTGNNPNN